MTNSRRYFLCFPVAACYEWRQFERCSLIFAINHLLKTFLRVTRTHRHMHKQISKWMISVTMPTREWIARMLTITTRTLSQSLLHCNLVLFSLYSKLCLFYLNFNSIGIMINLTLCTEHS